jgi:L-ascorbate metabolism protein UlaG (beta-lactamase superfamily)
VFIAHDHADHAFVTVLTKKIRDVRKLTGMVSISG